MSRSAARYQRIQPKSAMGIDLRYMPILLVFAVCFYFSYHLMQGKRSVWAYFSNISIISEKSVMLDSLNIKSADLKERNQMLRLETLDMDFLEEQAREQLGYARETEIIMID